MEKIFSKKGSYFVQQKSDFYEQLIWTKKGILSGIDEVGRGCLAGPVVACAAILHPGFTHPLLKDSKILTENQRLQITPIIKENCWYAFGIIDHTLIDKHNIYEATLTAMKRAYYGVISQPNLPQIPQQVLVDAMPLKLIGPEILSFTKGESRSISIAAASILAKVMRDELMTRFENYFPGYNFGKNKGYGAQKHRNALQANGISLIHRKSFLKKLNGKPNHEQQSQQTSLFC